MRSVIIGYLSVLLLFRTSLAQLNVILPTALLSNFYLLDSDLGITAGTVAANAPYFQDGGLAQVSIMKTPGQHLA